MSTYNHLYHTDSGEKVVKAEPVRSDPNQAWRIHKRIKALAESIKEDECECNVCSGSCGKYDTIELDSGVYYVCCDECADKAIREF